MNGTLLQKVRNKIGATVIKFTPSSFKQFKHTNANIEKVVGQYCRYTLFISE